MSDTSANGSTSVPLLDFVGLILTSLFVVVLVLVVFLLSALQFKDTIQNSSIADPKPNTGNVRQGVATIDGSYGRSARLIEQQHEIETEIEGFDAKHRDFAEQLTKLQQDVFTAVQDSISHVTDPALASVPFPLAHDPDANNYLKIREVYVRYHSVAIAAINSNGDKNFRDYATKLLDGTSLMVTKLLSGYNELRASDSAAYNRARDMEDVELANNAKRQAGEAKLVGLLSPDFRDLCEELFSYKSLSGNFAYEMIFMPKTSLTLALAVTMGLLGSLIFLARERVIGGTRVRVSNIVFRASLGGALAIAIYVFAAAGVFAIGQHAANSDGSIEMSPYLISFIGITAGYLSDHMAAWMAQIGRQAFKIDGVEGKERWSPHLAQYMGVRTSSDLARALNATLAQVEDWIAVKQAVPGEMQALLAVYLDVDMSLLFTDIPPRTSRVA